jgi:hypothetical protein
MPNGSFTYHSGSVPLSRPSDPIGVFRYDAESGEYELLPNILALQISFREGADPGSARFRYDFGTPAIDDSAPRRFEDVYPLDAQGPLVVSNDDRLVVKRMRGDGSLEVLFDGFALIPQADLDGNAEVVSFTAVGTPIREWDTPLGGALVRDADTPAGADSDTRTALPARFNPNGQPNASPGVLDADEDPQDGPTAKDSGTAPDGYPVFLGPVSPSNRINDETIRPWTLGMAVRYVLATGNPDEKYTTYAALEQLDEILKAIEPKEDGGAIDRDDPGTFVRKSIVVQDYDVTGEPWPVAIERLIAPHGFGFRFVLETDDNEDPHWRVSIYRKDDNVHVKELYLQAAGEDYDPTMTNVGALRLARDAHGIVNRYVVDTAPVRIEASFILSPLFVVAAGDATDRDKFIEGHPDFAGAVVDKYRLFGFDECGEGHWDFDTHATDDTRGDLNPILWPDQKTDTGDEKRPYAYRRRPGRRTLIKVDDEGKPFHAKLHVSKDYAGTMPGVWDGKPASAKWQEVTSGEWELLPDRLGIRVTCKDPNSWPIGKVPTGGDTAYDSGGKLCLVEWIAAPTTDYPYPRFRLTTVIEDDRGMDVEAVRRDASPTTFEVTRRIDARDRFERRLISKFSCLADPVNVGPDGFDEAITDDEGEAKAHADGMRRAHELGVFAGSVTIPRLTTAYSVGDKVRQVSGRDISLQVNAAAEQSESPIYPSVVAITWDLDGRQMTHISIQDERGEPAPRRSESRYD